MQQWPSLPGLFWDVAKTGFETGKIPEFVSYEHTLHISTTDDHGIQSCNTFPVKERTAFCLSTKEIPSAQSYRSRNVASIVATIYLDLHIFLGGMLNK